MRFSRIPPPPRIGRVRRLTEADHKKIDRYMSALWTFDKVMSSQLRLAEQGQDRQPAPGSGNKKLSRD
jgi:phage-related tail protein